MESLGYRIKYLRERNNISQIEFAKKIGVSNTVLSRYESGDRKPDYDTLQLIADFFDVSTDYLLGRTDTSAHTPLEESRENLTPKQQEILDFLLERENLFFKDKPEDIIEALDQFEIFYEVWKKQQKKTKD